MKEIIKALRKLPYEILILLCATMVKEHEAHNWDNLMSDLMRELRRGK